MSTPVASNFTPWRAVFFGTPSFVVPALDALAANPGIALVAAVTPPRPAAGPGANPGSDARQAARPGSGHSVWQPPSLRSPDAVVELAALAPDLIVVAAYGGLLPPSVLARPRLGCLNLHPSLLPRHRGPSPVAGALLAGDAVTGVSVMLLDEGMDTGPVIARRERRIAPEDDAGTLTAALFSDGAALLNDIIPQWAAGALVAVPQAGRLATYSAKIERSDGRADFRLPAALLARRQRAYTPWPGLYTHWNGAEVKLLQVDAIPGRDDIGGDDIVPGRVALAAGADSDAGGGIVIGAGDGLLAVRRLQLAGRRPAAAADFLRGYPQFIGAQLD